MKIREILNDKKIVVSFTIGLTFGMILTAIVSQTC